MGTNNSKIMKVGRVTTGRRLVTLVMNIFSKFFFNVVQYVPMSEPEEEERDIFKKSDHFAKSTFRSQAGVPQSRVNVCVSHAGLRRDSADSRPYLGSLGKELSEKCN